ncbi:PREDICTED: protein gar2 [Tarenaya hassleriana]|uniref:protein gar2 n=1 Tax=Tarenaya hassleriana TaxID=28532 RepID=UPI00053C1F8D|nr:PREDICTED: protein gar2 [Tarenaya hassleriana]
MGSADQIDDRTFNADFSNEGVAKLRERVKDKLKEFMGDYTDDTLVEYVIVLLRNGRRKEEAQNELNVFLGDDSKSFINWLWDHLAESLDEYLCSQESLIEQTTKIKSVIGSQDDNKESVHLDSESEKGQSDKPLLSRRSRKWRELPNDAAKVPPLISSEVHKIDYEEKKDRRGRHDRRSPSPQARSRRKRSRSDDRKDEQREAKHDVSRRLLQFAVRDALAISKPSNSLKESSSKRLRSVVSTSTEDSSAPEPPQRIRSVARVVNPMSTVMKAVAEAAEDVKKTKTGRSVFDRISHSTDLSETLDQHVVLRDAAPENEERVQPQYPHGLDYNGTYDKNMSTFDTGLQLNAMSNHGKPSIGVKVSHTSFLGRNRTDNPTSVYHNVAIENHVTQVDAMFKNTSFSGNIDPGKHFRLHGQREVADVGPQTQRSLQEGKINTNEAVIQSSKANMSSTTVITNGNVKPATNVQQGAPKTPLSTPVTLSTIRPSEDADARTIFVTNVHFGATKDSLSRHFNKFGEVLKVVIVTDPATRQPTGSAYIEFMRKEAADNALSLDGTSFMSRILKIVKGSSSQQDAAPTMAWPRATRGSTYTPTRFPRASPYGRGMLGGFMGRPPVRPGARSMQWKRDSSAAATAVTEFSSGTGNSGSTPIAARSLTYIRTDQKSEANDATKI